MVYAVQAARAAVPDLGGRWVVDGHNQGGVAAWAVAEMEVQRHDPGYLGAVSVAPGPNLRVLVTQMASSPVNSFYLDYIASAIHARTPAFEAADMLTGATLARYGDVTTKGCYPYGYASLLGAQPPVLKAGWTETPGTQRFFRESEVGGAPITGPLLVIAGEGDQTVPIETIQATVQTACRRGVALEFRRYPGLDHDPTMDKSTPDQLAWIADRFAGKPSGNDCSRVAPQSASVTPAVN